MYGMRISRGYRLVRSRPCTLSWQFFQSPYFNAEELLLLTVDDAIVGFIHLGDASNEELTEANSKRAVLSALCILPNDQMQSGPKFCLNMQTRCLPREAQRLA